MRSDPASRRHAVAGFTLLEVMVALAVVSLGLIGVFNGIIQISDQSSHLRERAFAHWVAMNEVTRLRVDQNVPEVSEFDGDVEFADTTYRWEATVSETGVEDLLRIDLRVGYADTPDDTLAETVAFVAPRPPPGVGGNSWSGAGQDTPGERDDGRDDDDNDNGNGNDDRNDNGDGSPNEPIELPDEDDDE
jgi:general secretion pathway protein I